MANPSSGGLPADPTPAMAMAAAAAAASAAALAHLAPYSSTKPPPSSVTGTNSAQNAAAMALVPTPDASQVLSTYLLPPAPAPAPHHTQRQWRTTDPLTSALHTNPSLPLIQRRPQRWSNKFNPTTTIVQLKSSSNNSNSNNKAAVIRAAFDAAGLAVLRVALSLSDDDHPNHPNFPRPSSVSKDSSYVPPMVNAVTEISRSRNMSIDAVLGRSTTHLNALPRVLKRKAPLVGPLGAALGGPHAHPPTVLGSDGMPIAASSATLVGGLDLGVGGGGGKRMRMVGDGGMALHAVDSAAPGALLGGAPHADGGRADLTASAAGAVAATVSSSSPPETTNKGPKKKKRKKRTSKSASSPTPSASSSRRPSSSPVPDALSVVGGGGGGGGGSSPQSSDGGGGGGGKRGMTDRGGGGTTYMSGPTTSACGMNIDSRSTAARAILCAAASIAYDELTPDFIDLGGKGGNLDNADGGEDGGGRAGGKIDVLDIPQNNTARNSGGDAPPTAAVAVDSSAPDATTTINMGAVLMSAQTYGRRAITQSLNAALRADMRRKYRVDCATRSRAVQKVHGAKLEDMGGGGEKKFDNGSLGLVVPTQSPLLGIGNPFALSGGGGGAAARWVSDDDEGEYGSTALAKSGVRPGSDGGSGGAAAAVAAAVAQSRTVHWSTQALPRLMSILRTGSGNAILHDLGWGDFGEEGLGRAGRVADLMRSLATTSTSTSTNSSDGDEEGRDDNNDGCSGCNFGPHLIVTTHADLGKFVRAFDGMQRGLVRPKISDDDGENGAKATEAASAPTAESPPLRALVYTGPPSHRRHLRLRHFAPLSSSASSSASSDTDTSLPTSPYHVVLTTYATFLTDYVHLTRIPYQCVVLDDGAAWMGLSHHDPNGNLGKAYELGLWSRGDGGAGGAGVGIGGGGVGDTALDDGWDWGSDDGGLLMKRRKAGMRKKPSSSSLVVASAAGAAAAGGDENGSSSKDGAGAGAGGKSSTGTGKDKDKDKGSVDGKDGKTNTKDTTVAANNNKSPPLLLGLTARHRLLLTPTLSATYRETNYGAPVPALVSFLTPQFADVVREEWERSRISTCRRSMDHVRKLVARGVVVHVPPPPTDGGGGGGLAAAAARDMMALASDSVSGRLPLPSGAVNAAAAFAAQAEGMDDAAETTAASAYGGSGNGMFPFPSNATAAAAPAWPSRQAAAAAASSSGVVSTEHLIKSNLLTPSRRHATAWLRLTSPLRVELTTPPSILTPILTAIKLRAKSGYMCEEIVTASSVTSSGAGGTVSGPSAYRSAVRCGRSFGSEQGLRQHVTAMHAPPGTWLCRTCGDDCGTSQARTHHERTCGHNAAAGRVGPDGPGEKGGKGGKKAAGGSGNLGGGVPTVGQGVGSKTGAGGKKKGGPGSGQGEGPPKDKDGSFRVPGYRGVWVNTAGKHFVKIGDDRLTNEDVEAGAADVAAKGTKKEEDKNSDTGGADSEDDGKTVRLFDTADEAAKVHDAVARHRSLTTGNIELNYKPDGTRIAYTDNYGVNAAGGPGLEVLGGGTSSVVPALAVINIRDLPPHVKPLLRDPRQTSRTGGNQKRYVYAYRGVCRQARKGHDRWQSQISFGGTNHYLGTFDSEWDAAAIYSWAHLILYGEEATAKAQKEGEEAAAAYEQEKKDIAAGKIIAPPAKPAKKKKKKKKSAAGGSESSPTKGGMADTDGKVDPVASSEGASKLESEKATIATPIKDSAAKLVSSGKMPHKKRPLKAATAVPGPGGPIPSFSVAPRKRQSIPSQTASTDAGHGIILAPGTQTVARAPLLTRRKEYADKDDDAMLKEASVRILALRDKRLKETVASATIRKLRGWSVCVPIKDIKKDPVPSGTAMLIGLDPSDFGWEVNFFLLAAQQDLGVPTTDAFDVLNREYGSGGYNVSFRTVLQTSACTIGRAGRYLEEASVSLGLGPVDLGGSAGNVECNIGGLGGVCSEAAARISYCPAADVCEYQFEAIGSDDVGDIVTLNGARIKSGVGSYPLWDGDICSVGSRVFVFVVAPK